MKIENIEVAKRLFTILEGLKRAISEAEVMVEKCTNAEAPIYMREYSDGSGSFDIELIYDVTGNYDTELYAPIAIFTLEQLNKRKNVVEKQLLTL